MTVSDLLDRCSTSTADGALVGKYDIDVSDVVDHDEESIFYLTAVKRLLQTASLSAVSPMTTGPSLAVTTAAGFQSGH